jgi:hypothetical protein
MSGSSGKLLRMATEQRPSIRGAAGAPMSWQLLLLASTALALSIASGWTTWDGMTNFTDSRWLSLLITFGIQGVMLISAWLIGESFASQQVETHAVGKTSQAARSVRLASTVVSIVAVLLVVLAVFSWLDLLPASTNDVLANYTSVTGLIGVAIALLLTATLITHRDIGEVYMASGRTILRNLPLWVMFLMCMAASVFFSFDSLFTRIFPPAERARASDIRAQRDLAAVLADTSQRVAKAEADAIDAVFESGVWSRYNASAEEILASSRKAIESLRVRSAKELSAATEAATRQRAELARLEAEQSTLEARRDRLAKDLSGSRADLGRIDARVSELEAALRKSTNALQDVQVAMEAELKGVGRTGVAGRGPVYRGLKRQEVQHQIEADAQQKKLDEQAGLRAEAQARIAKLESAAATMAGDVAQLASRITIKANEAKETARGGSGAGIIDAINATTSELSAARRDFQQATTADALIALQQACSKSVVALSRAAPEYAGDKAGARCQTSDLKRLVGAIAVRRQVTKAFAASCGKSAIPAGAPASQLIGLGRRCVRVAALDGPQTTELGSTLNRIALRRDDTAHRFVVSTNAFLDANQLAYLALAIAIAIDALIFISGLFGAAAAVPSAGRGLGQSLWISPTQPADPVELSDQQALMSVATAGSHRDVAENLLSQANPIMPDLGYTHSLPDKKYSKDIVSALNAGIAAGVVHWKQDPEPQYLISPAFFVALARIGNSGSAKGPEDSGPELGEGRAKEKEDRVREQRVSQIAS